MSLLALPTELLILLSSHLHSVEDFINLSSTCRALHGALHATSPKTILQLAAKQPETLFRPHPHFLVAATGRELSQWGLRNESNHQDVCDAFRGGVQGLLDLCVAKCGLTLDKVRRLHRLVCSSDFKSMIDKINEDHWKWLNVPFEFRDYDEGMISSDMIELERSVFQVIIYGELFGTTMDAVLHISGSNKLRFNLEERLDFIKYCIPDRICRGGYDSGPRGSRGLIVLPVGPYAPDANNSIRSQAVLAHSAGNPPLNHLVCDQYVLDHTLSCRAWNVPWEEVREEVGDDFDEGWKQKIWHASVQLQGLEVLEMLRPGGLSEVSKSRLKRIRDAIQGMSANEEPKMVRYYRGSQAATEIPNMADEVDVCSAAYWVWEEF